MDNLPHGVYYGLSAKAKNRGLKYSQIFWYPKNHLEFYNTRYLGKNFKQVVSYGVEPPDTIALADTREFMLPKEYLING